MKKGLTFLFCITLAFGVSACSKAKSSDENIVPKKTYTIYDNSVLAIDEIVGKRSDAVVTEMRQSDVDFQAGLVEGDLALEETIKSFELEIDKTKKDFELSDEDKQEKIADIEEDIEDAKKARQEEKEKALKKREKEKTKAVKDRVKAIKKAEEEAIEAEEERIEQEKDEINGVIKKIQKEASKRGMTATALFIERADKIEAIRLGIDYDTYLKQKEKYDNAEAEKEGITLKQLKKARIQELTLKAKEEGLSLDEYFAKNEIKWKIKIDTDFEHEQEKIKEAFNSEEVQKEPEQPTEDLRTSDPLGDKLLKMVYSYPFSKTTKEDVKAYANYLMTEEGFEKSFEVNIENPAGYIPLRKQREGENLYFNVDIAYDFDGYEIIIYESEKPREVSNGKGGKKSSVTWGTASETLKELDSNKLGLEKPISQYYVSTIPGRTIIGNKEFYNVNVYETGKGYSKNVKGLFYISTDGATVYKYDALKDTYVKVCG